MGATAVTRPPAAATRRRSPFSTRFKVKGRRFETTIKLFSDETSIEQLEVLAQQFWIFKGFFRGFSLFDFVKVEAKDSCVFIKGRCLKSLQIV